MSCKGYIVSALALMFPFGFFVHALEIEADGLEKEPIAVQQLIPDSELARETERQILFCGNFSSRLLAGKGTPEEIEPYLNLLKEDPNDRSLIAFILLCGKDNPAIQKKMIASFQQISDENAFAPFLSTIVSEYYFERENWSKSLFYAGRTIDAILNDECIESAREKQLNVVLQSAYSTFSKAVYSAFLLNRKSELQELFAIFSERKCVREDPQFSMAVLGLLVQLPGTAFVKDVPFPWYYPHNRTLAQRMIANLIPVYMELWKGENGWKILVNTTDKVHFRLLELLAVRKQLPDMIPAMEKLAFSVTGTTRPLFLLNKAYQLTGRNEDAVNLWKKYVSEHKNIAPIIYFQYIESLERIRNYQEALKVCDAGVKIFSPPACNLLFLETIRICAIQEKYAEALRRVQLLADENPEKVKLKLQIQLKQKDYPGALKTVRDAMQRMRTGKQQSEKDMTFWFLCLRVAEFNKDFRMIEEILLPLVQKMPEDSMLLNYLGYTYAEWNVKLDEADKLITKALRLKPGQPEYLDSLAWLRYRQKRYEEAKKYILEAIDAYGKNGSDTPDAEILAHAGDIYEVLNDLRTAISFWKKALKKKPNEDSTFDIESVRRKLSEAEKKLKDNSEK